MRSPERSTRDFQTANPVPDGVRFSIHNRPPSSPTTAIFVEKGVGGPSRRGGGGGRRGAAPPPPGGGVFGGRGAWGLLPGGRSRGPPARLPAPPCLEGRPVGLLLRPP